MYGLIFPFPSSRKCLHVSIYIFLKQNANPAASPPSLPVFQASRLWDQPCQWKMPLSHLSLISWDQLVTAANKWLRGQGSCGESLCQAECTTGHSPGNSGARLPSYWPFMQSFVDNGLLWKYLRQVKRDATFKREKKIYTTAVAWHRRVQQPTFPDWQRPATYIRLLTKAEQEAYLGSTAVDGCGVSKYADKKQKWRTGTVTETQIYSCYAAQLRLRSWQAALTESCNNSPGRSKVAENNHDPKTKQIPSKPLDYRQDAHLVTSVTITYWLPRQLRSSSHFSPPSHAALNINCW